MTSAVLVACSRLAGVYMGRTGIMSREVTRGVSELTLRVTMPSLLFTRVVAAILLRARRKGRGQSATRKLIEAYPLRMTRACE